MPDKKHLGARFPFTLLPFPFPFTPSLRSWALQLGSLMSAVRSPSGVWGRAPAEIEFGAF